MNLQLKDKEGFNYHRYYPAYTTEKIVFVFKNSRPQAATARISNKKPFLP